MHYAMYQSAPITSECRAISHMYMQHDANNDSLPSFSLPFNCVTLMILLASYEYKRIALTNSLDAHIPLVSL